MSKLFEPIEIRGIEIKNRSWVSPMCQYSAKNGAPTWTNFGKISRELARKKCRAEDVNFYSNLSTLL